MMPIENAVHLCVDMQRIFSRGGLWETPWMERVLPTIVAIAAHCPERTVFTRFVTPASPEEAPGQWQAYFRRWKRATREMLDPVQLDLVPELARYVPPATVIDKPAYSAFFRSPLASFLLEGASAPSSCQAPKPMCACCRPYSMPSISAFAWSSSRTRCAARRMRDTTP
jgi:nicotinamidase-related amidase